eukprot:5635261-Amphidinium_carterae.1
MAHSWTSKACASRIAAKARLCGHCVHCFSKQCAIASQVSRLQSTGGLSQMCVSEKTLTGSKVSLTTAQCSPTE